MLVLDRQAIGQDLWIEISSRWSPAPPFAAALAALGITLTGQSRILHLEPNGASIDDHHLRDLLDPMVEDVAVGYGQWAVSHGQWAVSKGPSFEPTAHSPQPTAGLDVLPLPGVTDAEGEMASLALAHAGVPGVVCHAGLRYRFREPVPAALRPAVERLLGNGLIHRFHWHDEEGPGGRIAAPPAAAPVRTVAVRDAGDDELLAISRRFSLALDRAEMRAVRAHFASLDRDPTDVELQSIALAWSEHCSHKTFKATILFDHAGKQTVIDGLLRDCLAAPTHRLNRPWVRSAFVDNAGVIAFDAAHDLAFKVETHNHPSALEPYGGAHTGIGGVIRDVLAVSAEPIGNTDVLCFGPSDLPAHLVPAGVFHPARTYREVVRGVADYGNNMGIPTVGGAILFHPGYTANPLVFCGTLGLAPAGAHPRDPRPGDAIVLLGGRTGRDGLHGATMSSESLDRETVAASTVQIGAPITEKLLRDVLPRLRDERLYHAITDCGAGGLCSAVGEMGAGLGVDVELARVPLKYQGLSPWEIWLSEAQERMVLAVPPEALPRLHEVSAGHDLEATELGRFRADARLRLTYHGEPVADVAMSFLHEGRPPRVLHARWSPPGLRSNCGSPLTAASSADVAPSPLSRPGAPQGKILSLPSNASSAGRVPASPQHADGHTAVGTEDTTLQGGSAADSLLALLRHPNIASKEDVIRRYDHEVGGATVLKPLAGNAGPSDAAVLRPTRSWRGVVVSHGINPLYGEYDPHAMAMLAVDEALRNLVAAGGSIDRAALLDNFCWGDVDDPDELGRLVRAAQGCRDAALGYRVPFISGKDSLRNTSSDATGTHSIPGTLLISCMGIVPDIRRCVSMELKRPGTRLYVVGLTAEELGGSHYALLHGSAGVAVPRANPTPARRTFRRLTRAIRGGLVQSCHDLSEGGLAVAAAEMSLAGGLGLSIDVDQMPVMTDGLYGVKGSEIVGAKGLIPLASLLFGESPTRFLVEVAEQAAAEFETLLAGVPHGYAGRVTDDGRFTLLQGDRPLIDLPVAEIEAAWKGHPPEPSTASPESISPPRAMPTAEPARSNAGPAIIPRHPARALVLTAAGVNCDPETLEALRLAGAEAEPVHLNQLLQGRRHLDDFGVLILPGGFSYGDHLGAGAMLASVIRHRLMADVDRFIADGRPVLGICNGFQILARLGLLGDVSLVPNHSGRFECRWVRLRVASPSLFLHGLDHLELPIAHGEGRVVAPDEALPDLLRRAPLRYLDNPNGSVAGIAAVSNATGNVLGMMPHPERFVSPYQHPARRIEGEPAGLAIFRNAVRYVEGRR